MRFAGGVRQVTAKYHFHTHPGLTDYSSGSAQHLGGLANPSPDDSNSIKSHPGLPHLIFGAHENSRSISNDGINVQTIKF
jgi:hypothetical protein